MATNMKSPYFSEITVAFQSKTMASLVHLCGDWQTIFLSGQFFTIIIRICFKTIKVAKERYKQYRQQHENRRSSSHTW